MKKTLLFCTCIFLGLFSINAQENLRPNIIVIMADDLGYADVGYNSVTKLNNNFDLLVEKGIMFADAPPAQLYDLKNDVSETTNLYYQYPDKVKEMKQLLNFYKNKSN